MNRLNQFFRTLYSSPSLIWKAAAGLSFLGLGLFALVVPTFMAGLSDMTRYGFSGLLMLYGVFRLFTFYMEYKNAERE